MSIQYKILVFMIIITSACLNGQDWNYENFNTGPWRLYPLPNYEETVLITPPGPGKVEKIFIYLYGEQPGWDTLYVVGNPSEYALPPVFFTRYLNTYASFVVNYTGQQGWIELDVSDMNIRAGGNNAIGIQHLIKEGGPNFLTDSSQNTGLRTSFLNNVFQPNPNFFDIRGTLISLAHGDFYAAVKMDYDYPDNPGTPPQPKLIDVTSEAGLDRVASAMVSVVDYNNDGWDDIAIRERLFENNKDGTFSKVETGFGSAAGTTWGDLDNDGYVDVFVALGGGNDKIFWGNEDGSFIEETDPTLVLDQPTVTPMFLDIDNDGLLDIYVAYGRTTTNQGERYYPDKLFHNQGNRTFKDITLASGIGSSEATDPKDCWGASITDYNDDGLSDIFVANYRLEPDFLFENKGEGNFEDVGAETGARGNETIDPRYFGHGMGSDWGDFDNDGDLDLAIGNLAHPDERGLVSNKSLILRNDNGKFTDVTDEMNLRFLEMNSGILWVDLNNDGWLDIVHSQLSYQNVNDVNINVPYRNTRVYINQGIENNYRLIDKTWEYGLEIHGAWTPTRIDYDNDGDQDLLIASSQDVVRLFRNDIEQEGDFITFKVDAINEPTINNDAFGTKVKITVEGRELTRWLPGTVHNGRASQSTNDIHFGIDSGTDIAEKVEFRFATGDYYIMENVELNKIYNISYDKSMTSIVENNNNKYRKIAINPNPISEEANITLRLDSPAYCEICIRDMNGKKVLKIEGKDFSPGEVMIKRDLSSLPNGLYYLELRSEGSILAEKFIISR